MILGLYAVKDVKAAAFMQPFVAPNDASATRSFIDAIRQPKEQSAIAKWPEDHGLYRLGHWDDNSGTIKPEDIPVSLGVGSQFLQVSNG